MLMFTGIIMWLLLAYEFWAWYQRQKMDAEYFAWAKSRIINDVALEQKDE